MPGEAAWVQPMPGFLSAGLQALERVGPSTQATSSGGVKRASASTEGTV